MDSDFVAPEASEEQIYKILERKETKEQGPEKERARERKEGPGN